MALGGEHVEAAGGDRLFLQPLHVVADRGFLGRLALGAFRHVGKFLGDAHVGVAAELDVGAASGHVGGDGDDAGLAGLGDDRRLALVVAGVEDLEILEAVLAQALGELLGLFDRGGADEDRLALVAGLPDLAHDRLVFLLDGPVDLVVLVEAADRHVGRHLGDFEAVDVAEFLGFRQRRAGHARQLLVHAEVVLEGDRGERLVLRLDRHMLLGLERLVQAFGIAAAGHHAAGELVDDDDLVVADDVVLVLLEQPVRLQRVVDVVDDGDVLDVVERLALEVAGLAQQVLELLGAFLGEDRGALLLVDLVVGRLELQDEGVDRVVHFRAVLERTGNDQRRAGFVDQDRIDLVDDRVIVTALHHRLAVVFHVVAQIVEAELVVGGVGDVGGVGGAALVVGQAVHDDADGQAEELVDAAHPFGVALGEIVVDGDDVDALAGERVEIDGERGDQRLAFAGAHLGDAAIVKHHAADELDVEGPHAEHAARGFAHGGEGRHEEIVERGAVGEIGAELVGAGGELGVGKRPELVLHGVDRLDPWPRRLDAAIVGGAEDLAGEDAETDHQMVLSTVILPAGAGGIRGTRQAKRI